MASRIKGITVEIDGDTTKLTDALRDVNNEVYNTQAQLKDVEIAIGAGSSGSKENVGEKEEQDWSEQGRQGVRMVILRS